MPRVAKPGNHRRWRPSAAATKPTSLRRRGTAWGQFLSYSFGRRQTQSPIFTSDIFGRSEIFDVSFGDSDLSESTANWNDFIRVDFTAADLDGAKMTRATAAGVHLSQKQQRMIDLKDADGDEPGGGQSGYASTRFQLPCFVAPAQPDDRQAAGRPRPAGQANLERQQDPGGARRSSSHLHRLKQRVCRHVMPLQTRTYRVWISPGYSLVSQPCALALEQHTQNPRQRMLQNQM